MIFTILHLGEMTGSVVTKLWSWRTVGQSSALDVGQTVCTDLVLQLPHPASALLNGKSSGAFLESLTTILHRSPHRHFATLPDHNHESSKYTAPARRIAKRQLANMSTLADEFLLDAGDDSGSDAGGDDHDDGLYGDGLRTNGAGTNGDTAMGDFADGGEEGDGDREMTEGLDDELPDDLETAKAEIEKKHLGGVRDVRTVAGLMKTLTPVLEVSISPSSITPLA